MIVYREVTTLDAKALSDYKKQVFDESDYLSRPGSEYNITLEEEIETIRKMLEMENVLLWIAVEDGEIISYMHINANSLSRMKHSASMGITVKKSWRGKGVGKHMMADAISFFESSSLHRLELTVVKENQVAVELYKKFGFVEEGLMKDALKKGDTYYDVLMMAKLK